jgi:hypothetical protein
VRRKFSATVTTRAVGHALPSLRGAKSTRVGEARVRLTLSWHRVNLSAHPSGCATMAARFPDKIVNSSLPHST